MKRTSFTLSRICILFFLINSFAFAQNVNFYVATTGSDTNSGTISQPFATVNKAKQVVSAVTRKQPKLKGRITVYLRGGTYFLTEPLVFTPDDSGTKTCPIIYTAYANEKVIISGGQLLTGKWQKLSGAEVGGTENEKSIYQLHIPEVINENWDFKQLFANGKRISRAASPIKYTKGALPQFATQIKRYDFEGVAKLKTDHLDAWCGFEFFNNDFTKSPDLANADVLVYHSWECSWHQVQAVNEKNNTVLFKSPSRYPVGFFGNKTRYRIENLKSELDDFGEWYLDKKAGNLYYYAYPNENPDSIQFIAPTLEKLMTLTGDPKNSRSVSYLTFTKLYFQHTAYPLGITSVSAQQKERAKIQFPWIDFSTGYTDAQAAPNAGEAISLTAVTNTNFIDCSFSHLGSFAIKLAEYSHQNIIENCTLNDLGAGGIIVGYDIRLPLQEGYLPESSPSNNKIFNNFIFNGGLVHPSAVAILVMQANYTAITHNEIYNFPYSGISCGWTWGEGDNYTKANIIAYNHIHHVMNDLDDGGGIYTLGNQPNASITNNHIHDINRPFGAIGSFNNGIFFDEGSKNISVSNNVIHTIENQYIRFNRSKPDDMNWGVNYFSDEKTDAADVIIRQAGHLFKKREQ
jgi:Right handed beta helix region